MFKNVASQQIVLLAIDTATNTPKTGDAANITAYLSKDYGTVTVLGDTSATEMDATNAPGLYKFDVTQTESNCDVAVFSGKSSTSGVRIVPVTVFMRPANATALSIDSSGRVDVIKVNGTSQTARDLGGQLDATVSSRMATYTQPTGFLAATFPTTVASTTNITGGTITTVTNLTNAPTNGDFTATMKASITTAATAATPSVTVSDKTGFKLASDGLGLVTTWTVGITGNITGNLSGSVGSVSGAVGSVTGNVGGNVVGSVGSVSGAVGSVTGNVGGNVTGSVGSVATGGITSTSFAAGAIDAAAIATDAIGSAEISAAAVTKIQSGLMTSAGYTAPDNTSITAIKAKTDNLPAAPAAVGDIPTAIQNANAKFDLADAIETGVTERMAFRLFVATLGGKSNGADTNTPTFRNLNDTKDVVSAETDDVGNRLTVTRDLT